MAQQDIKNIISKSDANASGGDRNRTAEPKPKRDNVQYFQTECLHDPCLRCNPYCPYCSDNGDKVK